MNKQQQRTLRDDHTLERALTRRQAREQERVREVERGLASRRLSCLLAFDGSHVTPSDDFDGCVL